MIMTIFMLFLHFIHTNQFFKTKSTNKYHFSWKAFNNAITLQCV